MNIKHVASKLLTTIFAIALLVGCSSNNQKSEDYEVFVDMIRDYAMEPESPDGIIHSRAATTEERKSEYKVVYVDAQFASYWCEDWTYTGGAHGNTIIHVGTLNRKTGKKLTLDDLLSKDQQNELAKDLRQKASELLAKKEQKTHIYAENLHRRNYYECIFRQNLSGVRRNSNRCPRKFFQLTKYIPSAERISADT